VKKRGFTIIELLVVLLLISLLLGIGSLALGQARRSSRDARRINDVIQIAQAIDQSASSNGGAYPRNQGSNKGQAAAEARMCANELYDLGNTNNLNLTLFTGKVIPSDPAPDQKGITSGCTSFLTGYTYHTARGTCGATSSTNSLAVCQQTAYSLEFGLENPKPTDDNLLQSPGNLAINPTYVLQTSTDRFVYLINGRYCGETCYTQ
jgi:prepilin-type N-terminal cleavage/methylation domain-containing protein